MEAHGVAVYMEAHAPLHADARRPGTAPMTRTTAYRGSYANDAALRSEFFDMSGLRRGDR